MNATYGYSLDATIADTWRAAHGAYKAGDVATAFNLYKGLRRDHGVELFYEVEPPPSVRFVHPIGAVLGRAAYADHLVVYQCSGVGSDLDGQRATFKGPCVLFPGARVLGNVTVGSNVFITANTVVSGTSKHPVNIPDNSVVFGSVSQPLELADAEWVLADKPPFLTCAWRPTKRSVVDVFFPDDECESSGSGLPSSKELGK